MTCVGVIQLTAVCCLASAPHCDNDNGDDDNGHHDNGRVAKCHGYGGYIRVKKLEGWGKKFGRAFSFAKSSIVFGKF